MLNLSQREIRYHLLFVENILYLEFYVWSIIGFWLKENCAALERIFVFLCTYSVSI